MSEEIEINGGSAAEETVSMDDLKGSWIKNPKVGEETEFLTIKKIVKNKNIVATDKEGKSFKTSLSGVDYKFDIHTDKGVFSPSSWESWGKIKTAILKTEEKDGHDMVGVVFKVQHIADGMTDKEAQKAKKCYKIVVKYKDDSTEEIF